MCGACTVLLDGEAVRSCLMLAVQADGAEIDDRRGARRDGTLHPLQQAFLEEARPAVRLLHAGLHDDGVRAARTRARIRPTRRSATRSPAISAAAPATSRSSRPRWSSRRAKGGRSEEHRGRQASDSVEDPEVTIGESLPNIATPRFTGNPMKRVEDPALLTGRAEFIDNLTVPGMLHCAMLRSPHAHARIPSHRHERGGETARASLGWSRARMRKRWTAPVADCPGRLGQLLPRRRQGACTSGQPVAAVAAISRYVAEDALELIEVEYEPLPAVMDALEAIKPDSPLINEGARQQHHLPAEVSPGATSTRRSRRPTRCSPRSSAGTVSAPIRSRPSV